MGLTKLKQIRAEALDTAVAQYLMGIARRGPDGEYQGLTPGLLLSECMRFREAEFTREDLIAAVEAEIKASDTPYQRTPEQAAEWAVIEAGRWLPGSKLRVDTAAVCAAYKAGGTLESLASQHHVSTGTVRNILKRAGVTLRKVGKPVKPKTE